MSCFSFRTCRPCRAGILLAVAVFAIGGWGPSPSKRFKNHVEFLASDTLGGRGVGSQGIEKAAEYIAEEFQKIGIEPCGQGDDYFQSFSMTMQRSLTPGGRLEFGTEGQSLQQERDFIPMSFSSDGEFSGKVAFCGYGIVAPERNRDDFAGIDPRGRVLLIFTGEPPSWSDKNGFATRYAMLSDKIYNAKDRGALAVLFVDPAPEKGEDDRLAPFDSEDPDEYGLPAFQLRRAAVDAELKRIAAPTLLELEARLNADKGTGAHSMDLAGTRSSGRAAFRANVAIARNVVGILHGSEPATGSVVIGAHYDHLGIRKPMTRRFKRGKLIRENEAPQIHNGADDNASGVAGLLEIARRFAAAPKPRRNVVFVAFTAEESGLHGSKFYLTQPCEPLEGTVAMLNMDMIGRMPRRSNRVQVFGLDTSAEFRQIVDAAASSLGLTVQPGQDAGGRSDHAPFVRRGIPSMHFFSGHHADYHKPTDDTRKINAAGGVKVAELVYRVAEDLATRSERPTFQQTSHGGFDSASAPTASYKVVMGLSPNYVNDGQPGMGVDGVTSQGPADLAGMKAGDRILRISDKPIANIYDYMAATRNNQGGDVVEVIVLRDGKEKTLKVKLAGTK